MRVPLQIMRRARGLIADELDSEGRHDEAKLCRAGMRDNTATKVLAEVLVSGAQVSLDLERKALIAGVLVGLALGFLAAAILFA